MIQNQHNVIDVMHLEVPVNQWTEVGAVYAFPRFQEVKEQIKIVRAK